MCPICPSNREQIVEDFEYPLTVGYIVDLVRRYGGMFKRVAKRPYRMNLTFDQLARWYDLRNGELGRGLWQRFKVRCMVWRNLVMATFVCLLVSRRVRVPIEWAMLLDILAEDFWVDDLVNRHRTRPEKVEAFMCMEGVLGIPIVVSERGGRFFVEDGNHRHRARAGRGFRKVRAVRI